MLKNELLRSKLRSIFNKIAVLMLVHPRSKHRGILEHNKFDFLAIFLLLFLSPLFFYKLGQSSLISFDEAWYADIARNILKSGDTINLTWNGRSFNDHPPAGFWLTALSYLIFGASEFSARFSSALLGLSTLITTYFLGKKLFNRVIGFASAIALS